ncbi:MAG TPA: DNA polymerase III subunit delta' [Candidatus Bipolaricaulota bacterium]|nr:DNA polymerase III subunit delta' [Candidatus Bipolaricaulota bacterium]
MKDLEFDWPILGQEKIKKFLQKSVKNESFTHAYLFYGPNNVGKTLTAKLFAKTLLCENYKKFREGASDSKLKVPCNQCSHCRQFEKNIHPDVNFLERELNSEGDDSKTQISIKQVQGLQDKISKRAFLNSYKIVLVPQADSLNEKASNSLLKTLEEPAQKTVIILIARSKNNLLDTIVSRCQSFSFSAVSKADIYDYLLGQSASRDQAKIFSRLALGRPTRAMRLLSNGDQYSALQDNQAGFLRALCGGVKEKFFFADEFSQKKKDDLLSDANEWSIVLRDLLLTEMGAAEKISNIHLADDLLKLRGRFSCDHLTALLFGVESLRQDIIKNINIKLSLENFFLKA